MHNIIHKDYWKLKVLLPFIRRKFPVCLRFCRIMIPSMHPNVLQISSKITKSSGGKLLLSPLISTQLRTFGMSSKSIIRREVKPKTKDELIKFWAIVDRRKCTRYLKMWIALATIWCQNFLLDPLILHVYILYIRSSTL